MDERRISKCLGNYWGTEQAISLLEVTSSDKREVVLLKEQKRLSEKLLKLTQCDTGKEFYIKQLQEVIGAISSYSPSLWIGINRDNLSSAAFQGVVLNSNIVHRDINVKEIPFDEKYVKNAKIAAGSVLRSDPFDDTAIFLPKMSKSGKVLRHGNEIAVLIFLWVKKYGEEPLITFGGAFCDFVARVLCLTLDTAFKYLKEHKCYSDVHCEKIRQLVNH